MLSRSDKAMLLHLPHLQVDSSSFDSVAFRTLPTAIAGAIALHDADGPQFIILSGDIVSKPLNSAFDQAYRMVAECSLAAKCSTEMIISIPGELDNRRSTYIDLLTKSLRTGPAGSIVGNYRSILLSREAEYDRFAGRLCPPSDLLELLPPAKIYRSHPGFLTGVLALDSSLFAVGDDSDRGKLSINGASLLKAIRDKFTLGFNVIVMHHPPTWLAPSEQGLFLEISKSFNVVVCGHVDSPNQSKGAARSQFQGQLVLVNATTSQPEFQIILISLQDRAIQIITYSWSSHHLEWRLISSVEGITESSTTPRTDALAKTLNPQDRKSAKGKRRKQMDLVPYVPIIVEATKFVLKEVDKWIDNVRSHSSNNIPSSASLKDPILAIPMPSAELSASSSDLSAFAALMDQSAASTNAYQIKSLVSQIQTHYKNFVDYQSTEATMGQLTPPHIRRGMELEANSIVAKLDRLKSLLAEVYKKKM
jgi:hypothetical protein